MPSCFKTSGAKDLSTIAINGQAPTIVLDIDRAVRHLYIVTTSGTALELFFDRQTAPIAADVADFIYRGGSFGNLSIDLASLGRRVTGKVYLRQIAASAPGAGTIVAINAVV